MVKKAATSGFFVERRTAWPSYLQPRGGCDRRKLWAIECWASFVSANLQMLRPRSLSVRRRTLRPPPFFQLPHDLLQPERPITVFTSVIFPSLTHCSRSSTDAVIVHPGTRLHPARFARYQIRVPGRFQDARPNTQWHCVSCRRTASRLRCSRFLPVSSRLAQSRWIFARIDFSGREFVENPVQRIAVLALDQDMLPSSRTGRITTAPGCRMYSRAEQAAPLGRRDRVLLHFEEIAVVRPASRRLRVSLR
jgi:hypothetical protein